MAMTWKEVLLAGLPDARIQTYMALLEKALEEEGENRAAVEEDLNRAILVNLEEYGEDFVGPTLAKLASEVEGGLEDWEAIGAFFYALPIYVDLSGD